MQVFGPATLCLLLLAPANPDGTQSAPTGPFEVHGSSQWVDAGATEQGVTNRLGGFANRWSVELDDRSKQTPVVEATLRGPNNQATTRTVELQGETNEARSRELAAVMTLWIEQSTSPDTQDPANPQSTNVTQDPQASDTAAQQSGRNESTPAPTQPDPQAQSPKWWLGGGARLELGGPSRVSPSGGLGVRGGFWIGDHLQPLIELEWIGSHTNSSLHALSFGAGLAAGAWITPRKFWLGGAAIPHLEVVGARGTLYRTEALFGADLLAMGQIQRKNIVFGLRTGIALNAPSIGVAGNNSVIVWDNVRWVFGFTIGWVWS